MGSEVTIRPARIQDADAIARLSDQLGYPASREEVEERLAHILGERDHAVYVAVSAQGEVVGWIHIYLCPLVEMALQAEIGGLVVEGRLRGRGIGQRLLERAERWAAERGCSAVMVRSNVVRERAHRFYARLGYRLMKTQRVFTKRLV